MAICGGISGLQTQFVYLKIVCKVKFELNLYQTTNKLLDKARLKSFAEDIKNGITLSHKIPTFDNAEKMPFEKIVGKVENAGY